MHHWQHLVGLLLLFLGLNIVPSAASAPPAATRSDAQEAVHGLTLDWIERLPRLQHPKAEHRPDGEGWPEEGQVVTWRAHLRNRGARTVLAPYRWLLDSQEIARGEVSAAAGGRATVDLPWPWSPQRHQLMFFLGGQQPAVLETVTDALALGLWVERSLYEYFERHQHRLGVGSSSFAQWAERHIRRWNQMMQQAVYPETPSGVSTRLRLDRLVVVPDGALPLSHNKHAGARRSSLEPNPSRELSGPAASELAKTRLAQDQPAPGDRSVDLQRGFPSALLDTVFRHDFAARPGNPFFLDLSLLHELGHARGLVDLYGFDVYHGVRSSRVEILEQGLPLPGSPWMPGQEFTFDGKTGLLLHRCAEQGLMNTEHSHLDRYSAVWLQRLVGQRPRHGSWNGSPDTGSLLNDLPARNRVQLVDPEGQPLAGAEVSLYRDQGVSDDLYGKHFDNVVDARWRADSQGFVEVGTNPFTAKGPLRFYRGRYTGVAILRVAHAGRVGYAFLESWRFNLAFWSGHTQVAEYRLQLKLLADPPSAPSKEPAP